MGWLTPSQNTPILFVAAVPAEVRALVDASELAPAEPWAVTSPRPGVDVLVAGIGRVNAAAGTAAAIVRRHDTGAPYRAVVNLGVAGALPQRHLNLGDVVVASACIFVEEGIDLPDGPHDMSGLGFELVDDVPWASANTITPDPALAAGLLERLGAHVTHQRIATVARCSGTDAAARSVIAQTDAVAEAMEGAAVVMAAQRFNIPAAEVRVISNTCGDREHQQWDLSAALQRLDSVFTAMTNG